MNIGLKPNNKDPHEAEAEKKLIQAEQDAQNYTASQDIPEKTKGALSGLNQAKNWVSDVVKNGYAIMISAIVLVALYFTPLGAPLFNNITLDVFASAFGVLFILKVMMSSSWRQKGKEKGKTMSVYKDRLEKKKKIDASISPAQKPHYEQECSNLTENIQQSDREAILKSENIDYADYKEKYLGKDNKYIRSLAKTHKFLFFKEAIPLISKTQAKAIIKANKVKREKLNLDMLIKLNPAISRKKRIKLRPSERELDSKYGVKKIIKKIINTALFALISKDLLDGSFSTAQTGWFLLISANLIYDSVQSYFGGLNDITVEVVGRMEDQEVILKSIGVTTDFSEEIKPAPTITNGVSQT
jgi:hypothetical protein